MTFERLGSDFRWSYDPEQNTFDLDDDWSIETDGRQAYVQNIVRLITCAGLWYAPGRTTDVRKYLEDIATDDQIAAELGRVIDGDERTARCEVRPTRVGDRIDVAIEVWDQAGKSYKLTLTIAAVDGAIILGIR